MEIVKPRTQPELLTTLKHLDKRKELPVRNKQHIISMEKGYEGEKTFDSLLNASVQADVLVLNDLLLTISDQSVQIDSLIITADTVHLYEIKNYKGDYQMKDRQLLTLTGKEVGNPLTQLNRTTSLVRQSLQQWRSNLTVEGSVIYVNPTFTLYHASPKDPLILPNQIQTHFSKLDSHHEGLTRNHRYLAERLLSDHRSDANFHTLIPEYDYQSLKKGISCSRCGSFDIQINQRMSRCIKCTYSCATDSLILEQVEEFKLLFPKEKVTVQKVNDWCGDSVTRRRIPRVLGKHYNKIGLSTGTHYV